VKARRKGWYLEPPAEARFRESVQQNHRWAGASFKVELADAVCMAGCAANFGHGRGAGAVFSANVAYSIDDRLKLLATLCTISSRNRADYHDFADL